VTGDAAALRSRLEDLKPGLRVLAANFLGLETTIDLICADERGGLVLALVARPGEELEGVANALAQAQFLRPRVRDWKKLAPDLPLDPEAEVRALLLAPEFGARAREAARAAGANLVELVRWGVDSKPEPADSHLQLQPRRKPRARSHPDSAGSSTFRTGMTDEDFGLES
jgi:hypothetical protein